MRLKLVRGMKVIHMETVTLLFLWIIVNHRAVFLETDVTFEFISIFNVTEQCILEQGVDPNAETSGLLQCFHETKLTGDKSLGSWSSRQVTKTQHINNYEPTKGQKKGYK